MSAANTVDPNAPAPLSRKQRRSIKGATARVNIWEGSVRSGKTIASLVAWLRFIATDAPPQGRLFMIGRTKDTLYRNVLAVIAELVGPNDPSFSYTRGANTAVIFGREVDILGANDAQAEAKITGATLAGAYVDEATLLPDLGFWTQLLSRMSLAGARLFATTNPDGPMHWFKTDVIDRVAELGYQHWHFLLEDNPSLDPEYVERIKVENTGLWYQRRILGLWVLADGAIWDSWNETRHVVPVVPRLQGCTVAVDYGTAGTHAAVLLGVGTDPVDQVERLYVASEWRWVAKERRRQLTDADVSSELRSWLVDQAKTHPGAHPDRLERLFVDPSASSLITQLSRDGWNRVRLASNDVADGIREVSTLLGDRVDRIRVHESVAGLRKEIPGYVWDPKKALLGEDAPVKANDHSCDAFRYGVRGTSRWWRNWVSTDRALAA